jgi:hypothetical protein
MTRKRRASGISLAGGAAAFVAVLTVVLDVASAVELRWQAKALITLLAGAAGFFVQRATALAQQRDAERERERLLDDALAWWPPPLVREADAADLGSFPPGTGDYTTREVDAELDAALAEPGYLVVTGPPGSGKTRATFEALARVVPDARLLVPEDPGSLVRVLGTDVRPYSGPQGTVLWLDCIDRFIEGLRLDAIDALVRRCDARVVGTVTGQRLDELFAAGGADGHVARRLMARATSVRVPGFLSAAERDALTASHPGRSFGEGVGSAFRAGWRGAPQAAFRASRAEPAEERRQRPDAVLAAAVLAMAGAALGLYLVEQHMGVREPAQLSDQITELRLDSAGCGIQEFAGTEAGLEAGEPLVVAVDRGRECPAHPRGADPVIVYGLRQKRLVPVFDFGPPRDGFPESTRFGCRGPDPESRCWTDVTGSQDRAVLGVFRHPDTQMLLPVAASRDEKRGWAVTPLLSERPGLLPRYRAKIYERAIRLGPYAGHVVADLAILPARTGDRARPARIVAGFAPRASLLAPPTLEVEARYLGMRQGVMTHRECIIVKDGTHQPHLTVGVPARDADLVKVLQTRWTALERERAGICVRS